MRELLPPEKLIAELNSTYPTIWREADYMRSRRGNGLRDWPQCVFLPVDIWRAIFSQHAKTASQPLQDLAMMEICSFLAAWRPTQDVVCFDQDFYACLADTPLSGNLPSDVLWRLPAWAIYVRGQRMERNGVAIDGFLAMLNEKDCRRELRLLFLAQDASAFYEKLSLGDWNIQQALNFHTRAQDFEEKRTPYPALEAAISLLLYICAYGFTEKRGYSATDISYPTAKKVKKGWRLFPPDRPAIHEVGKKIGDTLRTVRNAAHGEQGTRKSPRTHIRRAHWHGFWSGPKKEPEKRKFDLTWLPPIPVAMGEEQGLYSGECPSGIL